MTIKTNSFLVAGSIGAAKSRSSQGHDADRLTWSVSAAARRIGVGKTTLYKLSRERKLRLVKVAGRTLVPDSEIKRLLGNGEPDGPFADGKPKAAALGGSALAPRIDSRSNTAPLGNHITKK